MGVLRGKKHSAARNSDSNKDDNVFLTCSLLFLFELLLLFLVFRLCVKVVVAVLGELPLVGLIHQVGRAACQVDAEFLNVDFHDAAVNCHAHLKEERNSHVSGRLAEKKEA